MPELLGVGADEQTCKQPESKNRERIYTRSATVDLRPVFLLIGCVMAEFLLSAAP